MGRFRYGLWWLDQATAGARAWAGLVARGAGTAGGELRWAAELSARATAARIGAARPEPLSDSGLLAFVTVIAVVALGAAFVLGIGTARWAMTAPDSMLFASAGAMVVGLVFLAFAYLVFASRRGGR